MSDTEVIVIGGASRDMRGQNDTESEPPNNAHLTTYERERERERVREMTKNVNNSTTC